jgi:hypothetical protein
MGENAERSGAPFEVTHWRVKMLTQIAILKVLWEAHNKAAREADWPEMSSADVLRIFVDVPVEK